MNHISTLLWNLVIPVTAGTSSAPINNLRSKNVIVFAVYSVPLKMENSCLAVELDSFKFIWVNIVNSFQKTYFLERFWLKIWTGGHSNSTIRVTKTKNIATFNDTSA